MADIRVRVSDDLARQITEVGDKLGLTTQAEVLRHCAIAMYTTLNYSSRWPDMQKKAAIAVTAILRERNPSVEIVPILASEIERVQVGPDSTLVWSRYSGEPYRIPKARWD